MTRLHKFRANYLKPKDKIYQQPQNQQNTTQSYPRRIKSASVPSVQFNLKLSPEYIQKSVPRSQNEPIFEQQNILIKSRSQIKRSYFTSRQKTAKIAAKPVDVLPIQITNKQFRRQLKLAFDPIPSFCETSNDTYSRSEENNSTYSLNGTKRRDFVDCNERLRFERQIIQKETNIEYLKKNYEQMMQSSFDSLLEHRANHFQKVLNTSINIKKTEINQIFTEGTKYLRMLKNYFCKSEMDSIEKRLIQQQKLPQQTTSYAKMLLKCPQRTALFDLRAGELNPNYIKKLQQEFHEECQFHVYLLQKLQEKEENHWNRQRLEFISQFEKVADDVNHMLSTSQQLQQVVKFTDEVRKGILVGDLQINQVEEEIVSMKNAIQTEIDRLQDIIEDERLESDVEVKLFIRSLVGLKQGIKNAITAKQRDLFQKYLQQIKDVLNE